MKLEERWAEDRSDNGNIIKEYHRADWICYCEKDDRPILNRFEILDL